MLEKLNEPIHFNENRYVLRILQENDSTDNYLRWINDVMLMKYTESNLGQYTKVDVTSYIGKCLASSDIFLWGIFCDDGSHIGNIKLGPIIAAERRSSLGLIIGDSRFRGKGVATGAIAAIVRYAESGLGLSKLTAGVLEPNVASLRAFQRNGFVVEGREHKYRRVENEWVDKVILGRSLGSFCWKC